MLSYRSEVSAYINHLVWQVVLQSGMKIRRKLDTLRLFYDFISNCILYYIVCVNSVHYHTEIACSEPISHA